MNKQTLRKQLRKQRDEAPLNDLVRASEIIFGRLMSDENIIKANVVMTYVSMGSEVGTHRLINALLKQGKRVAVPVVNGRTLDVSYINSMDDLESSSFEILEPKKSSFVRCEPSDIDAVIVPAIAFDQDGHRIGYGAGFYDELLPRTNGVKIGICYDFCIIDSIFPEAHDVKVNYIITEKRVINNAGE